MFCIMFSVYLSFNFGKQDSPTNIWNHLNNESLHQKYVQQSHSPTDICPLTDFLPIYAHSLLQYYKGRIRI